MGTLRRKAAILHGCWVGLWHLAHLTLPRSLSGRGSYCPSLSADFSDQIDRDRHLSFDPAAALLLSPYPATLLPPRPDKDLWDSLPWWPESCRSRGLRVMSSGPVLENTPFPAWGPKLSNHKEGVFLNTAHTADTQQRRHPGRKWRNLSWDPPSAYTYPMLEMQQISLLCYDCFNIESYSYKRFLFGKI